MHAIRSRHRISRTERASTMWGKGGEGEGEREGEDTVQQIPPHLFVVGLSERMGNAMQAGQGEGGEKEGEKNLNHRK